MIGSAAFGLLTAAIWKGRRIVLLRVSFHIMTSPDLVNRRNLTRFYPTLPHFYGAGIAPGPRFLARLGRRKAA
jgi:hypothetical protein